MAHSTKLSRMSTIVIHYRFDKPRASEPPHIP